MIPRLSSWGLTALLLLSSLLSAGELPVIRTVDGQPLGANAKRLLRAMKFLGSPLPSAAVGAIIETADERDPARLEAALDPYVLFGIEINPELRVKVLRGPAPARLRQDGYTPVLVKVMNQGTASLRLNISSPQSGPVYAGAAEGILRRQQQTQLKKNENIHGDRDRFLDLEMFRSPPMTPSLSGLEVEYAIALIYSAEAGKREATIAFDVGQGTQDLGFRGELPVLFAVEPAIPVRLSIRDDDGTPTAARLTIRDPQDHVYPPQAKRVAPDFFFQPQIYREDGDTVRLPPGRFQVTYSRGPEYRERKKTFTVSPGQAATLRLPLKRWIDPTRYGYYCGDHHIHAAGCSHYQFPTLGVSPHDMFLQVKGEGLNVGCILTWGPCFEFQRRFFSPLPARVSEPLTVLKYDLEISGFGSAALGHVCLLDLKDQTYPGSQGTKTKGWPSWTVPVLRWAKAQGGVAGYPHSDMFVDPPAYAKRYVRRHDANADGLLSRSEAEAGLLPEAFDTIDADRSGRLTLDEMRQSAERASNRLPNLVLPAMGGSGAMEIFVSVAEGVCDFISAMDTGRVGEWNTWYHLMNCGFPLKVSGETDFPCMSSRRVGQGRVYVKLSDQPLEAVDFGAWCRGLAQGRSYVSDGYAHALAFTVNGIEPGSQDVYLLLPGAVSIRAKVAFAPEVPMAVAYGTLLAPSGRRDLGDTRLLHAPRSDAKVRGGARLVEIVKNGFPVASMRVPADGRVHDLSLEVPVSQSSWLALRQFPELHTNPVNVIVGGKPIRASRESALWCAESVELLWENRSSRIKKSERTAAQAAYNRAKQLFESRAKEAALD